MLTSQASGGCSIHRLIWFKVCFLQQPYVTYLLTGGNWYIPCKKLSKTSTALIHYPYTVKKSSRKYSFRFYLVISINFFPSPFCIHLRKGTCEKMFMHHNKITNITYCILISKSSYSRVCNQHPPLPCTLHIFYSLTLQSLEAVLATPEVVKPESQAVQFWLPVTVLNVPTGQARQGRVSSGE